MPVTFSWSVSDPSAAETTDDTDAVDPIRDMDLDPTTGDIYTDDGDLAFNSGVAAIASDLKSRWSTFKGEWFLDLDMGVDYWDVVFVHQSDLGAIEAEFRREAMACPGVTAVEFTLTPAAGRELNIAAQVTVDTGAILDVAFGVNVGGAS